MTRSLALGAWISVRAPPFVTARRDLRRVGGAFHFTRISPGHAYGVPTMGHPRSAIPLTHSLALGAPMFRTPQLRAQGLDQSVQMHITRGTSVLKPDANPVSAARVHET